MQIEYKQCSRGTATHSRRWVNKQHNHRTNVSTVAAATLPECVLENGYKQSTAGFPLCCVLLTGLLRSAGRMYFPSTWSLNLRRASSRVGLCPAFPSFPRTRPLSKASRWPAGQKAPRSDRLQIPHLWVAASARGSMTFFFFYKSTEMW